MRCTGAHAGFATPGAAGSIHTAGVPMRLTKRMAHIFMNEVGTWHTPIQGLRRAQVTALGGGRLDWAVAGSFLGDSLENEDFWESVVHFLANNSPLLERSYVGPIVDYIRHQKYVPQRLPQPQPRLQAKPRTIKATLR